jgi:hypothetical protein
VKHLFLVALLALPVGCSTPGKINADAIDDLVDDVCARHDAYVAADPDLDEQHRASDLRSSAILREIVAESKKAKGEASVAPVESK